MTGVYKEMAEMDFGSARFDAGYMLLTGGRDIPAQDKNGLYCRAFLEMKKPGQADGFIADWVDPSDGRNRLEGVSWSRHDSLLRWQGVFRSERYIQFIVGMLGTLLAVIMVIFTVTTSGGWFPCGSGRLSSGFLLLWEPPGSS